MIYVITGPPAAGKTTWVRGHAQPGRDITVDFDAIANALANQPADNHDHAKHIHELTLVVRRAAIRGAMQLAAAMPINVYIIDSYLSATAVAQYEAVGAVLTVIDPGKETVMERAKAERPAHAVAAAERWYGRGGN